MIVHRLSLVRRDVRPGWQELVKLELEALRQVAPERYMQGIYEFLTLQEEVILPRKYADHPHIRRSLVRGDFYMALCRFDRIRAMELENQTRARYWDLYCPSQPVERRPSFLQTPIPTVIDHLWPVELFPDDVAYEGITREILISWIADHHARYGGSGR